MPAHVSVSVPTLYDTGVGATEPTIPPMFVYVQGQNRRSGCDQTKNAANNDEPAQGTPARQAPTEDAEASVILMYMPKETQNLRISQAKDVLLCS